MAIIQVISFDAVGTLIHPDPPVEVVYAQFANQFGIRVTPDEIRQRLKMAARSGPPPAHRGHPGEGRKYAYQWWRGFVQRVFQPYINGRRVPFFDELFRYFESPSAWQLDPAVPRLFNTLSNRGIKIVLASNFDDRLRSLARAFAIDTWIDRYFLSMELGYPKSSPEFYQKMIDELGLHAKELIHIGDHPIEDVQIPHRVGIRTHLVQHHLPAPQIILNG